MKNLMIIAITGVILVGCSSSPKLYPNAKYQSVGRDRAEQDIVDCEARADEFLDSPKGQKMVEGAGAGALIGGAVGAVTGIFTGDIAGSALRGGAVGGAGGGVVGALTPDQLRRQFLQRCLGEQGYDVIGFQ
jgi:outer membrane lipoprotein SlyB